MVTAVTAMFASSMAGATAAAGATTAATMGAGSLTGVAAAKSAGILAASGGAGGLGGIVAGLSAGDLISGALTGISALGEIGAGQAEADALELEARLTGIQATEEELQGRQDVLEANMLLNDQLSTNLANTYGAGLRSSGSAAQASEDALAEANFSNDLTMLGAKNRAAAKQIESSVKSRRADMAKARGYGRAFSRVADYGKRYIDRG